MSRFANRPAPVEYIPPGEDERLNRIAQQRVLKHFAPLLRAVQLGQIDHAAAMHLLQSVQEEARAAMLDKDGKVQPDLLLELCAYSVSERLRNPDAQFQTALTVRLARDIAAMFSQHEFAGSSFPYGDQASMLATISGAALHLRTLASGRMEAMQVNAILDLVCQTGLNLARSVLPGSSAREVYNFAQSLIRNIVQNLEFPETPANPAELAAAMRAQIDGFTTEYRALMTTMAAQVADWFSASTPSTDRSTITTAPGGV